MANMTTARSLGSHVEMEELDTVCRVELQRVETELEAVVTSQQQEAREVSCLKETIRSLNEDLNSIKEQLARNSQSAKSRKKIPPILSVSVNLNHEEI